MTWENVGYRCRDIRDDLRSARRDAHKGVNVTTGRRIESVRSVDGDHQQHRRVLSGNGT
jgi:hypothetical protein